MTTMQHGETGAALPRNLSRQRGKAVCDLHNQAQSTGWVNPKTGKSLDRHGTFEIVRVPLKKRWVITLANI